MAWHRDLGRWPEYSTWRWWLQRRGWRADALRLGQRGMVFAWWSPVGRASHWNLPDLDHDGWSGLSFRTFRMRSHPEYTTENAVDMNHLVHVHDYFDTVQVGRVSVEGAHLKNYPDRTEAFATDRPRREVAS